jgi:putative restriction endonuclease
MPQVRSIDEAIERLYELNVGVIGTGAGRHERPHKPLLLLAAMDLIARGQATPDRIPWSQALRDRFADYFAIVRRENDQNTPENPFLYLRGDDFWEPLDIGRNQERPLETTPTVTQANAGTVFARIKGGMERFFSSPAERTALREALLSRYFPSARPKLEPLFSDGTTCVGAEEHLEKAAEEPVQYTTPGRDPAFRRIILEVYDYQCAACGLRIKLPEADVTFVDGAHIIPFRESRNDHPTNGLALCKNHHWAMDRFLLVPTPEGLWKASPRLDPRRSPGERDLVSLDGHRILPPHDDAFRPNTESLAWRAERIYA